MGVFKSWKLLGAALLCSGAMGAAWALPYDMYMVCVQGEPAGTTVPGHFETVVEVERHNQCWYTSGAPTPRSPHDETAVGRGLNGDFGNAQDPADLECPALRNRIDSMKGQLDEMRALEQQLSAAQQDAVQVFNTADQAYLGLERTSAADQRSCESAIAAVGRQAYAGAGNTSCKRKRGQDRTDCLDALWSAAPGAAAAEAKCALSEASAALSDRAQKAAVEAGRRSDTLLTRLTDVRKGISKLQIRLRSYQKVNAAKQCPR